jgi:hypothetical protein
MTLTEVLGNSLLIGLLLLIAWPVRRGRLRLWWHWRKCRPQIRHFNEWSAFREALVRWEENRP